MHATATAVFQFRDASEPARKAIIDIQGPANEKSLSSTMSPTSPQLLPCNVRSQQKPVSSTKYASFAVEQNLDILQKYKAEELSWLLIWRYQRNLKATSSECSGGLEADFLDLEACTEDAMDMTDNVNDDQRETVAEKDVTDQHNDESINIYDNETQQKTKVIQQSVPPWSGFNSLCSSPNTALTSGTYFTIDGITSTRMPNIVNADKAG